MFAVPGWSVAADGLKVESVKDRKGSDEKPGANKRKRQSGAPANNVNLDNVANLWDSVIEGKSAKKVRPSTKFHPEKKTLKQKKRERKLASAQRDGEDGTDVAVSKDEPASKGSGVVPAMPLEAGDDDQKDKRKKSKRSKGDQSEKQDEKSSSTEAKKDANNSKQAPPAVAVAVAPPKLTPLQASMREKLVSARFRHLNETLYTRPSAEAFSLFEESPEMFQEYHEGFRRQVQVWPQNPVDGYIADIKARGSVRQQPKDKGKSQSSGPAPLVRTLATCTIADLGCGDGKLSESLQSEKKKLKLNILSYDLQSPSPLVTRADIANLPLEDGSVNTVIFCLALMGTNWTSFIDEAYRILHWKGELWITEIKSRFAPVNKKGKVVTHSVGNRKKNSAGKKGKADGEDDAATEEALAVEVDGAEARNQETDVSAFVEALRKRGFVLQGQGNDAVDLSNKMFVKMHFTKGAAATVGKNAEDVKEQPRGGTKKGVVKFIDSDKPVDVDETGILKPCVYKLR